MDLLPQQPRSSDVLISSRWGELPVGTGGTIQMISQMTIAPSYDSATTSVGKPNAISCEGGHMLNMKTMISSSKSGGPWTQGGTRVILAEI
eukprot:scaffold8605_cov178-Amphora_coffeaeformis.AAC.17